MASGPDHPERLRVALVGDKQKSWGSLLGIAGIDVIPVSQLADLRGQAFGLLVATLPADEAAAFAAAVAAEPSIPPVTLLIGSDMDEHPQARLIEILIHAKRDWVGTFDAIVDPVVLLDRDGAIVRANVGFARVVGRKVQEVAPLKFAELVGEPLEGQSDPVVQSLADGEARTEETRYARLSGIQLVTTSPLRGTAGEIHGCLLYTSPSPRDS